MGSVATGPGLSGRLEARAALPLPPSPLGVHPLDFVPVVLRGGPAADLHGRRHFAPLDRERLGEEREPDDPLEGGERVRPLGDPLPVELEDPRVLDQLLARRKLDRHSPRPSLERLERRDDQGRDELPPLADDGDLVDEMVGPDRRLDLLRGDVLAA